MHFPSSIVGSGLPGAQISSPRSFEFLIYIIVALSILGRLQEASALSLPLALLQESSFISHRSAPLERRDNASESNSGDDFWDKVRPCHGIEATPG